MRLHSFKKLFLCTAATALWQSAQAVPSLRISDSTTTITIGDGGAGDTSATPGAVVWVGSLGNWFVNVDTGITKPVQGSAESPFMDLSFVDVSSGPGTLTLMFSETGFSASGGGLALIGGTTAGTVSYATYWSATNTLFDLANPLTSQGPFGPGAYSGTMSGGFVDASLYSLTQVVTITHLSAGTSSGDAELRVPDGGASIVLLGGALAALGLFARRRARAN